MALEELLKDEKVNSEIIEALKAADLKDDEGCIALLVSEAKKHGAEVSEDEAKAFLAKVPLSEEELDNVSGGYWFLRKSGENIRLASVVSCISSYSSSNKSDSRLASARSRSSLI